jgi:hypothetical protein
MDFTRALIFPFDDDEWLNKLGLAVLIQFIPIVGSIALLGWSYEISRRVKQSDPVPLPDWQDFGGKLGQGFGLFIAGLVYQLPVIVYICLISAAWLIPVSVSEGTQGGSNVMVGGAVAFIICGSCIAVLYAIVAYMVYQAGYIRYLDQPELSTFFQFGENFAFLREYLGEFGQFALYMLLFGALASAVSSITLGLAGLVSSPFSMTYTGHLLGQLYGEVNSESALLAGDAPAV